jgi:predicted flap endonuclease-1-like 5' DNA nuclease
MLAGTFLLGVLLGYLIWGWLKGKVASLEAALKLSRSIETARESTNTSLLLRTAALEEANQKLETRISVADYRLRKAQEEAESLNTELTGFRDATGDTEGSDFRPRGLDEPTLADISHAMERTAGTADDDGEESAMEAISPGLRRGVTADSLEVGSQVFARTVEANDLKLIRGIGPKLEEILHRAGIQSWAQLALYKLPDLRTILEEAGPRYRIFDPKTWSVQARMAARGEWRKLKAYQDTLTELGE